LESILFDKIIVLIKVFPVILIFFIMPGYFLRSLIGAFAGKKIEKSIAVDFSLGYSLLLIPGLIAYFFLLKWTSFFIIWFSLLAVLLTIFFVKHRTSKFFRFSKPVIPSSIDIKSIIFYMLSIYVLIVTFVVLFLRGGHFIGDHQHHLAYIIKLLHNDVITPFVPMYEGATEIPYNYAYDINYIFSAVVVKLAQIDLNLYWDVSPALYLIFPFSAYLYLYKKLLNKHRVMFVLFAFLFVFYELYNWGPALDAEFMPIPDQFSRTIFLPLFFALFIDTWRSYDEKRVELLYIPLFLILASIIFTHVYSYAVIVLVLMAFTVVDVCFGTKARQKAGTFRLYVSLMLFSVFIFLIRIWKTDFKLFERIEPFFLVAIIALFAVIVLTLLSRKVIEYFAIKLDNKRARLIGILVFVTFVLLAFWGETKAHVHFENAAAYGTKYGNFLRGFNFSFFELMGIVTSILVFIISFAVMKTGPKGKKEICFPLYYSSEKRLELVDRGALYFLFSTALVLIFTAMPTYNVIISKFISQVYARRIVYFQEIFFIYWVALLASIFYMKFSGRINQKGTIAIVVLFTLLALSITVDLKDRLNADSYNRDYILKEDNVFEYIRENIEPWSVIASYKYAAMDVVAQTPNYFLSSGTVHSPRVPTEKDRQKMTWNIFHFVNPFEDILENIAKYNVSYILSEFKNDRPFAPVYDLERFNASLAVYPELFERVYSDDMYILYRVNYKILTTRTNME